jgi:DNA-directed RNA polymerase subunit H (RpoH/RPB5)
MSGLKESKKQSVGARRVSLLSLLLLFISFALSVQAQQSVDPRLINLEASFRARIENHLKTVLRDEVKFAVGLQIVPLSPEELKALQAKANPSQPNPSATPTPTPSQDQDKSQLVEGGYLPYPTVVETPRAKDDSRQAGSADGARSQGGVPPIVISPSPEEAKLEFKYVNIGIYLYEDKVDQAMTKFVREQTQNALIGIKTKIQVLSIAVPKVEKPSEPAKPFDAKKFLMDNMQSIALLGAAMFLGFFLLLAFAIVARILRGGMGDLASSIKAARGGDSRAPVKEAEVMEAPGGGGATPFVDVYSESFKKSLASIRQLIQERPDLIRDAISADAGDYAYLKAILPYIEYAEQKFLLESLGRTHLLAIAQTEDSDIPFEDLRLWINHLVERVSVRSLTNESASMRLIEASDREVLLRADHRQIIDFLLKKPTAGAMLLGMEILSEDEREEVLAKLNVEDWRPVLTMPAEKIAHEVKAVSRDLVQVAKTSTSTDGFSVGDLQQFWEKNLLGPTVKRLNALPIGEEDRLLRELKTQSERFHEMVIAKFWPVSALGDFSRDILAREWKGYSPEERLYVVLGLPERFGSILLELIPEGTARTVLLDNLKRAREKQDEETLSRGHDSARAFMDFLREKHGSKVNMNPTQSALKAVA